MKFMCGLVLAFVLIIGCSLTTMATATPTIDSITPNKGLDSQSVDVTINGASFHKKTLAVKLAKEGQEDIIASNLVWVSKEQATCTFDLNGKAVGEWDLVVSNTGTMTKKVKVATSEKAFIIEATPGKAASAPAAPAPAPAPKQEAPAAPADPNEKLVSIFFDFDKSNIRDDQHKAIGENYKIIKDALANGGYKYLVIGGHADDRGTKEYNLELSAQRAQAIKKYLVYKGGIPEEQILIYSYGEDYPAKEGKDEESWAYNRRVDVAVWKTVPNRDQAVKE